MQHIRDKKNELLAVIVRQTDFEANNSHGLGSGKGRVDVSPTVESLQLAMIRNRNKTFDSHVHLVSEKYHCAAQEAWVVIKGAVLFTIADYTGDNPRSFMLLPGDCCITYQGVHGYKTLDEDSWVYEFKSGPYFGREKDKQLIPFKEMLDAPVDTFI